jgi:acylglycerol lipase
LHGYGSYVDKFGYVAMDFANSGYDVIGFDFRGFGHSEGPRGLIENTDNFIKDAIKFVEKAKEHYYEIYKNVKMQFVGYGYSLGGACAVAV